MFDKLICPECKTINFFYMGNKTLKCYDCYHIWINPQTTLLDYEV